MQWFPCEDFQWLIILYIVLNHKLNWWIHFSLKSTSNNSFCKIEKLPHLRNPQNKSNLFSVLVTGPVLLLKLGTLCRRNVSICSGQSDYKWYDKSSVSSRVTQEQVAIIDARACLCSALDELCDPPLGAACQDKFQLEQLKLGRE